MSDPVSKKSGQLPDLPAGQEGINDYLEMVNSGMGLVAEDYSPQGFSNAPDVVSGYTPDKFEYTGAEDLAPKRRQVEEGRIRVINADSEAMEIFFEAQGLYYVPTQGFWKYAKLADDGSGIAYNGFSGSFQTAPFVNAYYGKDKIPGAKGEATSAATGISPDDLMYKIDGDKILFRYTLSWMDASSNTWTEIVPDKIGQGAYDGLKAYLDTLPGIRNPDGARVKSYYEASIAQYAVLSNYVGRSRRMSEMFKSAEPKLRALFEGAPENTAVNVPLGSIFLRMGDVTPDECVRMLKQNGWLAADAVVDAANNHQVSFKDKAEALAFLDKAVAGGMTLKLTDGIDGFNGGTDQDAMVAAARFGFLKTAAKIDVKTGMVTFAGKDDAVKSLKAVFRYPDEDGLKSGFTDASAASISYYIHGQTTAKKSDDAYLRASLAWNMWINYQGESGVELTGEYDYKSSLPWSTYDPTLPDALFERYLLGVRKGSQVVEIVYQTGEDGVRKPMQIFDYDGKKPVEYPEGWSRPTAAQMEAFRHGTSVQAVDGMTEMRNVYDPQKNVPFGPNDPLNFELHDLKGGGQAPVLKGWTTDRIELTQEQAHDVGFVKFNLTLSHEQLASFIKAMGLKGVAHQNIRVAIDTKPEYDDQGSPVQRTYMIKIEPALLGDAVQRLNRDLAEADKDFLKLIGVTDWAKVTEEKMAEIMSAPSDEVRALLDKKISTSEGVFGYGELMKYRTLATALHQGDAERVEFVLNNFRLMEKSVADAEFYQNYQFWMGILGVVMQGAYMAMFGAQYKMAKKQMELFTRSMEAQEKQFRMAEGKLTWDEKLEMYNENCPDQLEKFKEKWNDPNFVGFDTFVVGRRKEIEQFLKSTSGASMPWGVGQATGKAVEAPGGTGKDFLIDAILQTLASGYYPLQPDQFDKAMSEAAPGGSLSYVEAYLRTRNDKDYKGSKVTYKQILEKFGEKVDKNVMDNAPKEIRVFDPNTFQAGTMYRGQAEQKWKVLTEIFSLPEYTDKNGVVHRNADVLYLTNEAADAMSVGKDAITGSEGVMKGLKISVGRGYFRHVIFYADNDRHKIYMSSDGRTVDAQQERRYPQMYADGGFGDMQPPQVRCAMQLMLIEYCIKKKIPLPEMAELSRFALTVAEESVRYFPTMGNPSRSVTLIKGFLDMLDSKELKELNAGKPSPINVEALQLYLRIRPVQEAKNIVTRIREGMTRLMDYQGFSPAELKYECRLILEKAHGKPLPAEWEERLKNFDILLDRNNKKSQLVKDLSGEMNQTHINRLAALDVFIRGREAALVRPDPNQGPYDKDRKVVHSGVSVEQELTLRREVMAIFLFGTEAVDRAGEKVTVDLNTFGKAAGDPAPEGAKEKSLSGRLEERMKALGVDYDRMAILWSTEIDREHTENSTQIERAMKALFLRGLTASGYFENQESFDERMRQFELFFTDLERQLAAETDPHKRELLFVEKMMKHLRLQYDYILNATPDKDYKPPAGETPDAKKATEAVKLSLEVMHDKVTSEIRAQYERLKDFLWLSAEEKAALDAKMTVLLEKSDKKLSSDNITLLREFNENLKALGIQQRSFIVRTLGKAFDFLPKTLAAAAGQRQEFTRTVLPVLTQGLDFHLAEQEKLQRLADAESYARDTAEILDGREESKRREVDSVDVEAAAAPADPAAEAKLKTAQGIAAGFKVDASGAKTSAQAYAAIYREFAGRPASKMTAEYRAVYRFLMAADQAELAPYRDQILQTLLEARAAEAEGTRVSLQDVFKTLLPTLPAEAQAKLSWMIDNLEPKIAALDKPATPAEAEKKAAAAKPAAPAPDAPKPAEKLTAEEILKRDFGVTDEMLKDIPLATIVTERVGALAMSDARYQFLLTEITVTKMQVEKAVPGDPLLAGQIVGMVFAERYQEMLAAEAARAAGKEPPPRASYADILTRQLEIRALDEKKVETARRAVEELDRIEKERLEKERARSGKK